MHCDLRWMIRRDMPFVMEIENPACRWTEDEFIKVCGQRHCIARVAEIGLSIVGFLIYELSPDRIYLRNFAVHSDYRRQGIGQRMFVNLASKLHQHRRKHISVLVPDICDDAHLFLRACGYRAERIVGNSYLFVYSVESPAFVNEMGADA